MPRIILNDAKDLQNVVDRQNLRNETARTLQQLVRQLLQISGPYSRNAFILYDNKILNGGATNTDVASASNFEIFTRDGIHTLSQIQYISPVQTYIKNQILAFMGRRIDACCSDGTTSSMIFTASFISYLTARADDAKMHSLLEIEKAYRSVTAKLLSALDQVKLTKERLEKETSLDQKDSVRALAFLQAFTSSGGNTEIANAIADIFYNTPEIAWKYAIRQKYPYKETPEFKVIAKQEDCNASYDCTIMTPELCNEDLGKYYQRDKVDLLVMRNGMIQGSQCCVALMNYILQCSTKQKQQGEDYTAPNPLVILLPTQAKAHDFTMMSQLQAGAAQVGLELFIAAYERPFNTQLDGMYSIDALSAKANVNAFTENNVADQSVIAIEPFLIKNVSFKCDHHMCYIDDVIPYYDNEDFVITDDLHPAERHPGRYEYYHAWKKLFITAIDNEIAEGDKGCEPLRKDLYKALMIMTCKKCWYIEIGGKLHDQQTIAHILDDAAGAALAAIQYGVYLNGQNKLYSQARKLLKKGNSLSFLERLILGPIMLAARDMVYSVFGENAANTTIPFAKIIEKTEGSYDYINFHQSMQSLKTSDEVPFSYLSDAQECCYKWRNFNRPTSKNLKQLIDDRMFTSRSDHQPNTKYADALNNGTIESAPCQVGNLFDVLFERIREVSLRFVFTDSIVAPGTVWSDRADQNTEQKQK